MFKIGDKVKLTAQGIANWGGSSSPNPENTEGTVLETQRKSTLGFVYRVQWPDGTNAYKEGDLELCAPSPVRETTVVKKEIIPGQYGKIVVGMTSDVNRVYLTISQSLKKYQLAEAIKTLQTIHDAME